MVARPGTHDGCASAGVWALFHAIFVGYSAFRNKCPGVRFNRAFETSLLEGLDQGLMLLVVCKSANQGLDQGDEE